MWGLSVPIAYFLVVEAGFGVSGLWYVLLAEEALKALFLVWRWRTYEWGKS
jgi:Na+-driven multidrug efflux pump